MPVKLEPVTFVSGLYASPLMFCRHDHHCRDPKMLDEDADAALIQASTGYLFRDSASMHRRISKSNHCTS